MSNYSSKKNGIILAGGESRRMGKPKASLRVGQQTMLACVSSKLLEVVARVVIVCAPDQKQHVDHDRVAYAFDEVSHQGPLQGLKAGLQSVPNSVTHVFVTGCDAPFLKSDVISALFDHVKNAHVCAPEIGGVTQPMPAVYAVDVLPVVTSLLANGKRSLKALLSQVNTCVLPERVIRQLDPDLRSFENVNTPADYERILQMQDL